VNTHFYSAIRRIVAEQSEAILADPQRLKGFVADYAAKEPKPERLAFGRCIEYGFYGELKDIDSEEARASHKMTLARKLHENTNLDPDLCAATLDILEAVLFAKKIHVVTHDGFVLDRNAQSFALILDEFFRLAPGENNYIILQPGNKDDSSPFLAVALSDNNTYTLEFRTEYNNAWKVYRYVTSDRNETMSIMEKYFSNGEVTGFQKWKDITYEILNEIENETEDKTGNENARQLFTHSDDAIIRDMTNFFHLNATNKYGLESAPYDMFIKYYQSKGIASLDRISREYFERLSGLSQIAVDLFGQEHQDALIKKVMSLVGECVAWKPQNRKFTKVEIDTFLYEKNIRVSGNIRDMFYLKVNDTLQEAK